MTQGGRLHLFRRVAAFLLYVAALAALASCNPFAAAAEETGRLALVEARGTLIVGVKADYPPWGMIDADGAIVGLEPDLARNLADGLGVGLSLVPVTSANRLARLDQGIVDVVIATMGDTVERRGQADLIEPHYYASGVSLLARDGSPLPDWGSLRGRPVCLTDGAWFNRALTERYLLDPVIFPGTRDTGIALRDGRCAGWAYDDTVLAQLLAEPAWAGYGMPLPTILASPWGIAVARGEGERALGRAVADAVAEWHRTGFIAALQAKWGLPPNAYLTDATARWSRMEGGALSCVRGASGAFPAKCLEGTVARAAGQAAAVSPWITAIEARTGLALGALADPFNQARLLRGLGLTMGLSLVSIAGSLGLGVAAALLLRGGTGGAAAVARAAVRGLVAVLRMTPPIVQLYVLFFGLGGLLAAGPGVPLPGFLVAAVVFSFYAGATNAVLLDAALGQLAAERPGAGPLALLAAAMERAWEGLVSTSVNIVKAAGMASTIAVAELVSSVNTVIAEGGSAATMMNLLLVFYFVFVLAILGGLRGGRRLLARWS